MNLNEIPTIKRDRRNWRAKFTDDQVREIKALHASGHSMKALAIDYGVHYSTICGLIHGYNYKRLR